MAELVKEKIFIYVSRQILEVISWKEQIISLQKTEVFVCFESVDKYLEKLGSVFLNCCTLFFFIIISSRRWTIKMNNFKIQFKEHYSVVAYCNFLAFFIHFAVVCPWPLFSTSQILVWKTGRHWLCEKLQDEWMVRHSPLHWTARTTFLSLSKQRENVPATKARVLYRYASVATKSLGGWWNFCSSTYAVPCSDSQESSPEQCSWRWLLPGCDNSCVLNSL